MRGKTNAMKGVQLNATAVNKTLASGQIIAGDFVEYYSNSPSISQGSTLKFKFDIGEYSIALSGSFITAFRNGSQVATYAVYDCTYLGKCNGKIVFHDNSAGILGILSLENDQFTLVGSISTNDTTSLTTAIWGSDNKVCYAKYGNKTLYIGVADVSSSGTISNYHLSSIQKSGLYGVLGVGYYDGNFYIVTGSDSYAWTFIELSIDSSNEATINNEIRTQYALNEGIGIVYNKGPIMVFAGHYGTSSSSNTTNDGWIMVVNFVTGNYVNKMIADYGEVLSFINEDGLLITSARTAVGNYWYTYTLRLCEFSDSTYEIVILDSLELAHEMYAIDKMISRCPGGISNDIIYAQLKSGASPVELFEAFNGNQLQRLTQKNYVAPYNAGHPIGVAKESGAAGDTIAVYIPTPSA